MKVRYLRIILTYRFSISMPLNFGKILHRGQELSYISPAAKNEGFISRNKSHDVMVTSYDETSLPISGPLRHGQARSYMYICICTYIHTYVYPAAKNKDFMSRQHRHIRS